VYATGKYCFSLSHEPWDFFPCIHWSNVDLDISRRQFLGLTGITAGSIITNSAKTAAAENSNDISQDVLGVLVDTTLCIGCRKCEQACAERHGLPDRKFEDASVLNEQRRPDEGAYTVINKFGTEGHFSGDRTFVKYQCMHCIDPACASACITGALTKHVNGPVIYDSSKCIGCRYCMISCPFQIPAYEYDKPLLPRVRKCTFCFEYITKKSRSEGGVPACARVCPMEVMTFGKRSELLEIAKWKIKKYPGRYVNHIYGEHEVGGTSWMYMASQPFETLGFPKLDSKPPPRLTEAIQHGIFQGFIPPILLFLILGGVMKFTNRRSKKENRPLS
jgi:Fe-S-cluster-containing dehydrogenase component